MAFEKNWFLWTIFGWSVILIEWVSLDYSSAIFFLINFNATFIHGNAFNEWKWNSDDDSNENQIWDLNIEYIGQAEWGRWKSETKPFPGQWKKIVPTLPRCFLHFLNPTSDSIRILFPDRLPLPTLEFRDSCFSSSSNWQDQVMWPIPLLLLSL